MKKSIKNLTASALAGYLRKELADRNLSQAQLASMAGIRESTLSNLLNKPNVLPKPETLRKLATALNVPEAQLTALAGYAIDGAPGLADRYLRMARLIQTLSWLESGVEKWLQLPENEQEDILFQIESRLNRHRGKD